MAGLASLNAFVFITLACWGIWGILDKKALESGSHFEITLRLYLFGFVEIPIVFLALQLLHPGWHIPNEVWLLTCFGAIVQFTAITAYMAAMSLTEASYVLGITAAYPMVLQFLAVLFLGEDLIPARFVAALLICIGVATIGVSPQKESVALSKAQKIKLALCIIFATLGWGTWAVFDKLSLEFGKPLEIFLAERLWEAVLVVLIGTFCALRKIKLDLVNKQAWFYSTLSGSVLAVGRWTYLCALALASASYVVTITGCYPLLMYFLAVLFLKEKFNRVRLLGVALVVVGGIMVQLSHV
jgi:uncharacterized membrane protein